MFFKQLTLNGHARLNMNQSMRAESVLNVLLVIVISTLIGDLIELVIFRQLIIAQGLGRLLVDWSIQSVRLVRSYPNQYATSSNLSNILPWFAETFKVFTAIWPVHKKSNTLLYNEIKGLSFLVQTNNRHVVIVKCLFWPWWTDNHFSVKCQQILIKVNTISYLEVQ